MPAGLLPAGARALAPVPATVPGEARRLACTRASSSSSVIWPHSPTQDAFRAYLAPLRKTEWVVYAKRPFARAEQVLAYLARYTHRVAIANSRLIALDDNQVTFRWKDYREQGPRADQDDDARRRRVHPPLPAPRAARWLPSHPPLRPVRQRPPRATSFAQCSKVTCSLSPAATDCEDRRCTTATSQNDVAALSMLRRPHDRHRDLRARMLRRARGRANARSESTPHDDHRHIAISQSRLVLAAPRPATARARSDRATRTSKAKALARSTHRRSTATIRSATSIVRSINARHRLAATRTPRPPHSNPHSARGTAARSLPRGFLPWRLSDAGPRRARHRHVIGPASETLHKRLARNVE